MRFVGLAIVAPVVSATAAVDPGRHARIATITACPHCDTTGCDTLNNLKIDCKTIVVTIGDRCPV